MSLEPRTELAIVGGGPAGAFLAFLAARAGLRVRVLERARFPRPKPCGGVLSPRAMALLSRAGLRGRIEAAGARPIRRIHLVGLDGTRVAIPYGDGMALERRLLDALLLEAAASAGARVETGVEVAIDLAPSGGPPRLRLGAPGRPLRTIHAPWVIGAGGRSCPVRQAIGCTARPQVPHAARTAVALAAVLDGICAPAETCEMHVGAGGYCGVAACGHGRTCVGYVLPAAAWRSMERDPDRALAAALASRGYLAAGAARLSVAAGPWACGSLRAEPPLWVPAGVALAGDCLARQEPITGEGLAEAFASAWRIAAFLVRSPDPHTAIILHRSAVRAGRRARRRSALAAALGRTSLGSRSALSALRRLPALAARVGPRLGGGSLPPATTRSGEGASP